MSDVIMQRFGRRSLSAMAWMVLVTFGCADSPIESKSAESKRSDESTAHVDFHVPRVRERCVDHVGCGEEWFNKRDVSCPSSPAPVLAPAVPGSRTLDSDGCALLQHLACGEKPTLGAPAAWRLRRALASSTPLRCGGDAGKLEITWDKALDAAGRFPFKRTCPPPPGPHHPLLPLDMLSRSFPTPAQPRGGSLLEKIHAASGTSEYDHIEDAFRHLGTDDKRIGAISMLVGMSTLNEERTCAEMALEDMSSLLPVQIAGSDPDVMCDGGPFGGDSRFPGGACTAFFVAPRYLVTAGHCASRLSPGVCKQKTPTTCEDLAAVKGSDDVRILRHFARTGEGQNLLDAIGVMKGSEVELVACETAPNHDPCEPAALAGSDWAVFRLPEDPGIPGPGLVLSTSGPSSGTPVHMLSHVANLPLKYSGEGDVQTVGAGKFELEVDGFDGSSGAPVFDASGEVVGIFVEQELPGLQSCDTRNGCLTLPLCPAKDCTCLPRASLLTGVRAAIALDQSEQCRDR